MQQTGHIFRPYQSFLTMNVTPLLPRPCPPLDLKEYHTKVGELFCRVKSANVQQVVTHIPCKSKFFSIVALLKVGVYPNCTVLSGGLWTSPRAGTGGQRLRRLWGSKERVLSREAKGILCPSTSREGASEQKAPWPAAEPPRERPNQFAKSGRGNCIPFSRAPPTGRLANAESISGQSLLPV